jgi:hypothetical protein
MLSLFYIRSIRRATPLQVMWILTETLALRNNYFLSPYGIARHCLRCREFNSDKLLALGREEHTAFHWHFQLNCRPKLHGGMPGISSRSEDNFGRQQHP